MESRLKVLVDLAKNRIRIHKTTLKQLNNPDYILLTINPQKESLAIICSDMNDDKAHRVKYDVLSKGKSCEYYSQFLMMKLREMFPSWQDGNKYTLYGSYSAEKNAVVFNMAEAVPIGTDKVMADGK